MDSETKENRDINLLIRIKYQQNHAAQGSINWVENGESINFRSMMELFHLLVGSCEELDFRNWEIKK